MNSCVRCFKPESLCVCAAIKPMRLKTEVLIIRHPQEPDQELGTAQIAHLVLENSVLKTGLSCRNLAQALGHPAENKDWGVLYLGSAKVELPRDKVVNFVDKKGLPLAAAPSVKGIVVLDGTWSQAKALWWRNPWLIKLKRIVLNPPRPSLYGNLRREPRRGSLSSIEALAYTLSELEQQPEIFDVLLKPFKEMLEKKRGGRGAQQTPLPGK